MNLLRLLLVILVPLISFSAINLDGNQVRNSIYPIRFFLVLVFALIGCLILASSTPRDQSILDFLKIKLRNLKIFSLVPAIYFLWIILSALFSSAPGYSWLGHPYTQFGSLMLLGCITLLVIYAKAAPVLMVVRSLIITTVIMAILTVLEGVGLRPLQNIIHSENMLYPAATVGHRPHLGGWFAITALAPVFFYRQRSFDLWFWCWLLSSIVGLSSTTTSSASLGVFIALCLWLIVSFKNRSWKYPTLTLIVFCFSIFALPKVYAAVAQEINSTPPIFRDYTSTTSFKPRIYMWKSAFNSALERPFFGWGDDTFAYQVFKHLNSEDAEALFRAELGIGDEYELQYSDSAYFAYNPKASEEETRSGTLIYIRPHNILVDEVYSRGFIGLILFMSSIVYILYSVYTRQRRSLIYFIIMILPYSIYLMAWFYVNPVTPLFFILVGAGLAEISSYSKADMESRYV